MAEVDLFDFMRDCKRLAIQASGTNAGKPTSFFERGHASSYYLQRSNRDVQTLKVTTLTDTESLAVLDLQYSVEWKHDTRLGP
jgi:hypothetical protein